MDVEKSKIRWIIVAGCGHTGTTITAKVIGLNEAVFGLEYESSFLSPLNSRRVNKTIHSIGSKAQRKQRSVVCEKTPKHIHCIDFARQCLPEARFVLCTRNPYDTIASLAARQASPIDRSAIKKGFNRYLFDNIALIRQLCHSDVILHRYEDFVQDSVASVGRLCSHLKLDYQEQMLRTDVSKTRWFNSDGEADASRVRDGKTGHSTRRSWQVNQTIFDNRGQWRTLLDAEQVTVLNRLLDRPISR